MAERPPSGGPRGGRQLLERIVVEAARRGTSTIEAEHILLALASAEGAGSGLARDVLRDAGLDYGEVEAALRAERERSLAVVGIAEIPDALLHATVGSERPHISSAVRTAIAVGAHDRDRLDRARQRPGRGRRPGRDATVDESADDATAAWLAAADAWSAAAEAETPDPDAAKRAVADARRAADEARRTALSARRSGSDARRPGDIRHRRLDDVDVLIGLLSTELGTIARALAIAGVDRMELLERARTARDDARASDARG